MPFFLQLRYFETMHPSWEATVVELKTAPKFDDIVKKHSGTRDQIGSHAAAAFREDTYLVQFGPKVLGAMQPANRQQVARWVRQADASKSSAKIRLTGGVSHARQPA